MSQGTDLVTLLNDELGLGMDPIVLDLMGARFDRAFFDQGDNVDNLGAQLYLNSFDDAITTDDIQSVRDDNPEVFEIEDQPAEEGLLSYYGVSLEHRGYEEGLGQDDSLMVQLEI